MLTDLYLIRHAEPARRAEIAYNVVPGPDLSEHGRAEARQAAAFLADKRLDCLFASPFARTTQTVELLVDRLALPVTFTTLLQEHGAGESFDAVRARVREFLAAAADTARQRIGVVSHGSPIRAMLLELSADSIDLRAHNYPGGNPAPTAGIWHVRLHGEHAPRYELVFAPGKESLAAH